jgi:hypothetical protein
MPGITARGSIGVNEMGWGDTDDSTGALDMGTPAGWFHSLWLVSVVLILLVLWML